MNICILKENKSNEFRTPLIPKDIKRLNVIAKGDPEQGTKGYRQIFGGN